MSLCVYHSRLVKTWPAMAAEGLQTSSSTLPQEGTARRLFHFLLICLTRNDGKHSPLKQIINVLGMPHVPCNPPALFASSPRPRLRSREREREQRHSTLQETVQPPMPTVLSIKLLPYSDLHGAICSNLCLAPLFPQSHRGKNALKTKNHCKEHRRY